MADRLYRGAQVAHSTLIADLCVTMDHLYFIAEVPGGCVKIGRAKDPADRLRKMQVGNSRKLELLSIIRNAGWLEAFWHECFRSHRVRGEWFRDSQELREAIASPYFAECAPAPAGVDPIEWGEYLLDALEQYESAVLFEGAEPFTAAASLVRSSEVGSTGALDAFETECFARRGGAA